MKWLTTDFIVFTKRDNSIYKSKDNKKTFFQLYKSKLCLYMENLHDM